MLKPIASPSVSTESYVVKDLGYNLYMSLSSKIRVAVLRGGPSSEYEVSLKSGESILRHLHEDKYQPQDVLIDRQGVWHLRGLPVEPRRALEHTDVVVNGLHGEWGEDGKVQQLLDAFSVPYTGSGALLSAEGMNKGLAKQRLSSENIR